MEIRRRDTRIWNEMNDGDKMIYALFFEMEENHEVDIKKLLNEK